MKPVLQVQVHVEVLIVLLDMFDFKIVKTNFPNTFLFQKISARYNLTHEEARHCLWVNNGSFDDTIAWILTGYNCNGLPPWDHRDDEGLNSAEGIKRLIKKYGIEAVHERQYFLEL